MDNREARRLAPKADRWLRHDWKRWIRAPGGSTAGAAGKPETRPHKQSGINPTALADLRWMVKDLKVEFALRLLRRKYSPDQPRNPAGDPAGGGRWTDGPTLAAPSRVRLAGSIPTNDTPEIPEDRPPKSKDRTAVIRAVIAYLATGGITGRILEATSWVAQYYPLIRAGLDPPRTLSELQDAASDPRPGYDIHHIVEQTSAKQDGYSKDKIDSPYNLVRIPRVRHWEINSWYGTRSDEFGGECPRDYLRGRTWNERRRVGLDALTRFGVLKP